jgi:choline dehydrogenase-like flavoprotein
MSTESYDYVVIGGGSSGCTLAGRLSEEPGISVALVEAGPLDNDPVFHVPSRFWQQQKSSFDWDLLTEPEPRLGGRRSYLPRGRVLGGTSSMNTMLYVRGSAADYDGWAGMGLDGWSHAEVLPYFLHAEDNERGAGPYHATGGPLRVEDVEPPPLLARWVDAAREAGHPPNNDFNGARQEGVGAYQVNQRGGRRCSASVAYIHPNLQRANLTVHLCTYALGLVWDGDRVAGVEVEHCGRTRTIHCDCEAVLCAGAYLSPQLLMLSGIGPADHLRSLDLPVKVDNPAVGANLQDHPGCFLVYSVPGAEGAPVEDGWVEVGGFSRTEPGPGEPDLQFHAALGSFADEGVSSGGAPALSFGPYVTRPRSRGWVRLRSALPQAKPRILHNFLDHRQDRELLRRGIRLSMQVASQPGLGPLLGDRAEAAAAGGIPTSDSNAAIDDYIERTAFSFYHPAGTCAMGSVLDSDMRVHAVEGLRVCDASIMPTLLGSNTNAAAIMFAEKLACSLVGRKIDAPAHTGPGTGKEEHGGLAVIEGRLEDTHPDGGHRQR